MAKLTEEMVHARTRQSNLAAVSKLNCWGSELQDVSLVRRLPNVETLSLSVNRIRGLSDFQHCKKLKHLFVRKNDIRELNQICYLRELPALSTLWLAENPCAGGPGYRFAVLKALPNLEKLDDIAVTPEERADAQRHGAPLPHPDEDDPYTYSQAPTAEEVEPTLSGYGEEDTDEQFIMRDYGRQVARYSPETPSPPPPHSSYMRTMANSYHQSEGMPVQNNGYEAACYEQSDEDYRQPVYMPTPPSANHQRAGNKETMGDDESPPRSIKQDDDHEELPPRALLTRSRTESLPRLSRLDAEEAEEYPRNTPRCRLDSLPRVLRQEHGEDLEPRSNLTRSRTVDMLGGHHAGSLSSLHERERERARQKPSPCEVYMPRSLQPPAPATRPRNINVLNAVLCLIKELELQDLELVAMSVNCRIDELRV